MADSVSFNQIPLLIRLPYVYSEYDASRANQGPGIQPYKALMVGQKLSTGTVNALTPTRVSSVAQAAKYFGLGSTLHRMAMAWFAENKVNDLYVVAFNEPAAGVKAAGTITISGTPTESGTMALYIGGEKIQVAITANQTPTQIAAAIAAAINLNTSLPVTATAAVAVVTITAREKGLLGNMTDLRVNLYDGEILPAGSIATIVQMSGGTGTVDLTTLWPVLGDEHYNTMAFPWNDAATLAVLATELGDRAGPLRQIECEAFGWKDATFAALGTFGESLNEEFLSIGGMEKVPTSGFEMAASYAAVATYYLSIEPGRPLQTLPLTWGKAPAIQDRFTNQENNLLLFSGIATFSTDSSGVIRIQRAITTYQVNPLGADDPAYLDVETLAVLSYIRWSSRTRLLLKYPRHSLANDGTRFGSGRSVVTPKILKAEMVSLFQEWEELGLVEGVDQFIDDLIVVRSTQDPNRVDMRLPPDLVNQLRVTAIQIQFLV